jgi:AraC-like DNA-binding protein
MSIAATIGCFTLFWGSLISSPNAMRARALCRKVSRRIGYVFEERLSNQISNARLSSPLVVVAYAGSVSEAESLLDRIEADSQTLSTRSLIVLATDSHPLVRAELVVGSKRSHVCSLADPEIEARIFRFTQTAQRATFLEWLEGDEPSLRAIRSELMYLLEAQTVSRAREARRKYLYRRLRRLGFPPPGELRRLVRLTYAFWIQEHSNLKLSAVVDLLEFSSMSSFSRAARRELGRSPTGVVDSGGALRARSILTGRVTSTRGDQAS